MKTIANSIIHTALLGVLFTSTAFGGNYPKSNNGISIKKPISEIDYSNQIIGYKNKLKFKVERLSFNDKIDSSKVLNTPDVAKLYIGRIENSTIITIPSNCNNKTYVYKRAYCTELS